MTVTKEILLETLDSIIKETEGTMFDVYSDCFKDVNSIIKLYFTRYYEKNEGFSCSVDKASYTSDMICKALKNKKHYTLSETYTQYFKRINKQMPEALLKDKDMNAYWVPKTIKNTEHALHIFWEHFRSSKI